MHCIWSASAPMATSSTDVGQGRQQRPQMSHTRKLASFEGEGVQKVVIQKKRDRERLHGFPSLSLKDP